MKIEAEVLAVETDGDQLSIRYQGVNLKAAEWRPYLHGTIRVHDVDKHRRAYHVGRSITITLEPK